MSSCSFTSGRILYITTEILILVESCYSCAHRKHLGIIKLCCLTCELAKVTIDNIY